MLNGVNTLNFLFSFLAASKTGGLPWWAWLLIIIVIILILWFLWRWFTRPKAAPASSFTRSPTPPAVKAAEPVVQAPPSSVKPDDLTLIEGIGPKIASVLQAAGIITFNQLAAADTARLDKILIEAGLRLADPGTWPEQAALADAGKWDEFKALTDSLKGGRRV
jgi:predicted flap endonuclease-1-like 5' DNA nuclease